MEQSERKVNPACLERHYLALTVDDVYDVAKLIGVEVEKLIDGYGKESAEGLVPKIVKVLELLERFAARNNTPEQELIRAFETLQVQQQRKKTTKEAEDRARRSEIRDLELKEQKWRKKAEDMEGQVTQLREQNQQLLSQLTCNHSQEGEEILNDERCPGFLMEAVGAAINKQRRKIKAKMLGIPEGECSSDEEERGSFLSGRETGTDCTDGKPADSRIRNLFGILSRHGSGKRSSEPKQPTGSWEIIGAEAATQSLNTEAMQSLNTEASSPK
ncbi:UNVERIFIED_CONTAM: hypothetical protein FKN15_059983 [Acipenser sinensis]